MTATARPIILAGSPGHNAHVYRRIRFNCHDTVVYIALPKSPKSSASDVDTFAIMRPIEIDRARAARAADHIHAPAEFTPASGLSGDRDTANAQSAAELLTRKGVREIWTDRTLPMLFAFYLERAGIKVHCDPEMEILSRRAKSPQEVDHIRAAQKVTEDAVRMACELIARATADKAGALSSGGAPLTSERVQSETNIFLLSRGMGPCDSIVAGGPQGGDCHHRGSGLLRTAQTVIIDIFPQNPKTLYCGDCTRTVVHGGDRAIPDEVRKMHAAVVEAKRAAITATRAGVTGEQVHKAACDVFRARGYAIGLPPQGAPKSYIGFAHGTGHGIGLEVHEPPLLDIGAPPLVVGDALTIEPGLYSHAIGGIRVEDMVIVRETGCDNLNSLPEGLTWA